MITYEQILAILVMKDLEIIRLQTELAKAQKEIDRLKESDKDGDAAVNREG